MHKINCRWKDHTAFIASDQYGHEVVMDLDKNSGGNNEGFRPMPMLLIGLAGCLGVDVKLIADKMRINLEGLDITVNGITNERETPKTYKEIEVVFNCKGERLDPKQLEKAITLAIGKYCNVSAILSQTCQISHQIVIVD